MSFRQKSSPDLQPQKITRFDNSENSMIGYLHIIKLQNKIISLREVLLHVSLDYFVLIESKLDNSVATSYTISGIWL